MKTRFAAAVAAVAAGFVGLTLLQGQSKPLPADYQVLLNRSIFSKEPVRRERSSNERPRERGLDYSPVLTGVVQDEADFIAFLEDPRTGKVALARAGQELPQGTIEQITLTYLQLRPAGAAEPRRIELGRSLGGSLRSFAVSTPSVPAATTGPATTGPATTAPGGTGEAAVTPESPATGAPSSSDPAERLRQRRLREMQGK